MRGRSRFPWLDMLSRAWRSLTFVITLRAMAKPYRSRRLYPAEAGENLDLVSDSGRV
jgi:hypothetical protein